MPAFEYEALDGAGKKARGYLTADSEVAARRELRRRQLAPLKVAKAAGDVVRKPGEARSRKALSKRELMLVTRQLSSLIDAGMPVEESVGLVAGQVDAQAMRRVLTDLRSRVMEGERLSDAMAAHPGSFPPVYRAMVAAGEMSGGLGAVLDRLADYLEQADAVRRKLQAALIYPAALSVTAITVVAVLLIFIVPRLAEQFEGTGVTLPALTRFLIGLSGFLQASWPYLLAGIAVIVLGSILALRRPAVRDARDRLVLRMPVLGSTIRKSEAARFARTMEILLKSGALLPDALKAARRTAGNAAFAERIARVGKDVESGRALSDALRSGGGFPPILVYMVAAGERSGTLGDMFGRAAAQTEQELDGAMTVFMNLLEPMIIVVMGVVVTGIVLSILLPILQLNTLALG
ncbi:MULTISPECIES: type II secretion system inner membrane protein GspF [Hyphobacterium]|uniref:General secretion pathway protein F n=1 Tax=Hyphobacterium vulgare TaxID=1736751 RepID=A0ABV6ZV80_9PROT